MNNNKQTVLVTGNNGYIGAVLIEELKKKGYNTVGLDTNYFEGFTEPTKPDRQIIKDLRDITEADLQGIDYIIHLAALSNDPLGEFDKTLTRDINFIATVKLVRLAKKKGVKRFVYSSSQSMYGVSDTDEELEEDNSKKNPVTEYAKTKWLAEEEIKKFHTEEFLVTCFRPSTVFGASPMLRCDIVYNNLIASGYLKGSIEVRGDGSPWRPVVHVKDVCNAYIAGIEAPKKLVARESFNIGIENGNFSVKDLAQAAQKVIGPQCKLQFGEKNKDSRTYRVSFKKILTQLKDYYKPEWDLERGGKELVEFYKKVGMTEEKFKGRTGVRLNQLKHLVTNKELDKELRWTANLPTQAVIIAGGKGTRMGTLGELRPKALIDANGTPFIKRLLNLLKRKGITEVVMLLGYLPESFQEELGDGSELGMRITYSVGDISLDTGKRLKHAEKLLQETFLLLYSDNYSEIDLHKLHKAHTKTNALMTLTAYTNRDKSTKSNVFIDKENNVITYDPERKEQEKLNGVEILFAITKKEALQYIPSNENTSLKELFLKLIQIKKLGGILTEEKYCSIGKLERLPLVRDYFAKRKILFLDRDGVINKKPPRGKYVHSWKEFKFLPGSKEAIAILTKEGYEIYVVTNQPGIAKGIVEEKEVQKIHRKMIKEIEKSGGKIHAIYTCPHQETDECNCRKPKAGMIYKAQQENNIWLKNALFIGDDERDIEAAINANVKGILLEEHTNLLETTITTLLKK